MKTETILLVAGGVLLTMYVTRSGPFRPRLGALDETEAARQAMNAANAKRSRAEKAARGAAGAITSILNAAWPPDGS